MEEKLTELYCTMYNDGVYFFDIEFTETEKKTALIEMGGKHAVFIDVDKIDSIAEETEVIAHECGHIETGTTHKLCAPFDVICRHEYRANKWAVKRIIPFSEIEKAIAYGCCEVWEFAEFLGRTEEFVKLALEIYSREQLIKNKL